MVECGRMAGNKARNVVEWQERRLEMWSNGMKEGSKCGRMAVKKARNVFFKKNS